MNTVKALHTISGQVAYVPERIVNHPVLGKHLVAVDADAKSYAPELYKAKTVDEFTSKPRRGRKRTEDNPVIEDEAIAESQVAESFDTSIDEDN